MTEFVLVRRVEHGDTMAIVKEVADKYPNKFEPIVAKSPIAPKKTRKKKGTTKRVTKVEETE